MIEDTYFFDAQLAFDTASKTNKFGAQNHLLQICYYNGEKIDSNLVNLIHLPISNLVDSLANISSRIPYKLDFSGLNISDDIKEDIVQNFNVSIKEARRRRVLQNNKSLSILRKNILDFSQPLRFYIPANINTRVMQHCSQDIANYLKACGYEVLYDLQVGIEDVDSLNKIANFNPHVTININHINNDFLNDEVFNFIWFQDLMPVLQNTEKIFLRDRDYIFSYTLLFKDILLKKGVDENHIFMQPLIPADTNQFYLDTNIKRKKKIVFVGNYYLSQQKDELHQKVHTELLSLVNAGQDLSKENIQKAYAKYNLNLPDLNKSALFIQQIYIRNTCVQWLSQCKNIDFEIYGYNWEQSGNENIIKHFKGKIEKKDLNELYNSATYVFSASGQLINTQRLGETIHAGAIPVVYDSRGISDEDKTWDDECLYFKTQQELENILKNHEKPKKYRTQEMLDYFTYKSFTDTIVSTINKKTDER